MADEEYYRTAIRLAAAAGDVDHAIRTLAETPLTAGQITIAVMEKRREIAGQGSE